jgi:inosine triphosphate pyrophosphatase
MANEPSKRQKIYFVTGSANKFNEAKEIFTNEHYELVQYNLDLPEYQGDSEEIAHKKCLEAETLLPENIYPFFIEDTGLHYNCLNGLPGPYIKWFLKDIGLDGLVKLTEPYTDKTAYAKCIITLKMNIKTKPLSFVGKIDGKIVNTRGRNNFGWDPIFEVGDQTFAEMDKDKKNNVSHRCIALKMLEEHINKNHK